MRRLDEGVWDFTVSAIMRPRVTILISLLKWKALNSKSLHFLPVESNERYINNPVPLFVPRGPIKSPIIQIRSQTPGDNIDLIA